MPGDRVQMIGGVLQINGVPLKLAPVDEKPLVEGLLYRETFPESGSHLIIDRGPNMANDDTGVFEVSPGSYFVMGDNRDNATDSRIPAEVGGVGGVPIENITGTATAIYWSSDAGRIGKPIE